METSRKNAQYKRNDRYNLLYEIEGILSVLRIFFVRQTRQIQRLETRLKRANARTTSSSFPGSLFSASFCHGREDNTLSPMNSRLSWIVNLLWIHYYREFKRLCPTTCGDRENKEIKESYLWSGFEPRNSTLEEPLLSAFPLKIKEARKGFFGCYSVCETMKDTKEGYFIM